MSILLTIIAINVIISLISLIGVFFTAKKTLEEKFILYSISFAAGVMLAAVFLKILPEAVENNTSSIFGFTLIGIIVSFFLERSLLWYHHHHSSDDHDIHPSAILIIAGDSIHNFIDGIAVAATYLANPALGLSTAIAIAAHEIPQELADFGALISFGIKKKRVILLNFLSALTAVFGGIYGYFLLKTNNNALSPMLAFTAGVFIYVASADLIPELHRHHKKSYPLIQSIIFLSGVLLMFVITKYFAE